MTKIDQVLQDVLSATLAYLKAIDDGRYPGEWTAMERHTNRELQRVVEEALRVVGKTTGGGKRGRGKS